MFRRQFESQPYFVDKVYTSMRGPASTQSVYLEDPAEKQLLWIVGYRTEISADSPGVLSSQEFMCHANLDLSPPLHRYASLGDMRPSPRIFTLSQGQQSIRFPEGFGVPVLSSEPLDLSTQVLNLNHPEFLGTLQHRVTVEYVRDRDLKSPMKALVMLGAEILKVESANSARRFGYPPGEPFDGPGCGIAENADPNQELLPDALGQNFLGHWYVQQGVEKSHTEITHRLALPYDTKVHYAAFHLHPGAEFIELVDLTRMEQLIRAEVTATNERKGISRVEHFSSQEGLALSQSHRYGLVSLYKNPEKTPIDAMAVAYLYCEDKQFDKNRYLQAPDEFCPVFPGAEESSSHVGEQVVDVAWHTDAPFGEVLKHYQDKLDWDGPIRASKTSCYWTLGQVKTVNLKGPVEPVDEDSEAGVVWLWEDEEGRVQILYSHWRP